MISANANLKSAPGGAPLSTTKLRRRRILGFSLDDLQDTAGLLYQVCTPPGGLFLQPQVADVTPLKGLTNLQNLDLRDTQVVDLTPLQGLTNLRILYLHGTPVADVTPPQRLTTQSDPGEHRQRATGRHAQPQPPIHDQAQMCEQHGNTKPIGNSLDNQVQPHPPR